MKKHTHSLAIFGEVFGILLGILILLYVLPILPFVTSRYILWLPIGLSATILTGVAKILSHGIPITPLVRLFRIAAHLISLYSTNALRQIFPFDFSRIGMASLNNILHFALLITLFALLLAILIEFIKLITFQTLEKEK